jgi:formylglycine-generating enzyme required for sulfatase activity
MERAGTAAVALISGVLSAGCAGIWPGSSASGGGEPAAAGCPEVPDGRASLVAVPFTLRSAVESAAASGLVLVRYARAGCGAELEVVSGCRLRGRYAWRAEPRARQVVLRTSRELTSRLTLASGALERRLQAQGGLRIEEQVVGRWVAPRGLRRDRAALEGEGCERVTHVLTAVELGGYVVVEGAPVALDRAQDLFHHRAAPPLLEISRAGDAEACARPDEARGRPKGCEHALAVRLSPIVDAGPAAARVEATVDIPAGTFLMGADGAGADEGPRHVVRLDAFTIDRLEVTAAEYAACVDAGGCKPAGEGPRCTRDKLDQAKHPINCVSFADAEAYCRWANKRLPTEAEWERAARGANARSYPWGEAWPPPDGVGNLSDATAAALLLGWATVPELVDGFPGTSPVGTFARQPTAEGLLDVVGNVREWTADRYDPKAYLAKERVNPTGPARGSARVVRGSSFGDARPDQVRVTRRAAYLEATRSQHIGFRCAQSPGR